MLNKLIDVVDFLRIKITSFETFLLKHSPREKKGFYSWEEKGFLVLDSSLARRQIDLGIKENPDELGYYSPKEEICSKCGVTIDPTKVHYRTTTTFSSTRSGDSVCEDCFNKNPLDYVVVCSC